MATTPGRTPGRTPHFGSRSGVSKSARIICFTMVSDTFGTVHFAPGDPGNNPRETPATNPGSSPPPPHPRAPIPFVFDASRLRLRLPFSTSNDRSTWPPLHFDYRLRPPLSISNDRFTWAPLHFDFRLRTMASLRQRRLHDRFTSPTSLAVCSHADRVGGFPKQL